MLHPGDGPPDSGERALSAKTAELVDREVRRLVEEAERTAREQLSTRAELYETLANRLIEEEVVSGDELRKLLREHGAHSTPPPAQDEHDDDGSDDGDTSPAAASA
jgi:cell division protease FtsH